MLRVVDPISRIDEDWLIAAINFRLDESGTIAELELTSPRAFDQLPEIPEPEGGASDGVEKSDKFEKV